MDIFYRLDSFLNYVDRISTKDPIYQVMFE